MKIQKKLSRLGIEKLEELDCKNINFLAHYVANLITKTFPVLQYKYNEILAKILNCKMYYAKITDNIANVNYLLEDNSIYIDENINIFEQNEQIFHEIIHYLQISRKNNGKVKQMGLCNFGDFAINGLGINEAAVQYISAKIMNYEEKVLNIYGLSIPTKSTEIYPLLTNLMEQMAYLIGEECIIDSTINSNDNFEEIFFNSFEEKGKQIIKNFDKILEIKNELSELNKENREELEENVASIYLETQNIMISKYYEKIVSRLTTIEEVDFYIEKFLNHKKIIGIREEEKFTTETFYEQYKEYIMKKFDKQLIKLSREKGKNTLSLYNNKMRRFLKKIISYFGN